MYTTKHAKQLFCFIVEVTWLVRLRAAQLLYSMSFSDLMISNIYQWFMWLILETLAEYVITWEKCWQY